MGPGYCVGMVLSMVGINALPFKVEATPGTCSPSAPNTSLASFVFHFCEGG